MKMIIDIPDEVYKRMKVNKDYDYGELTYAIDNGILYEERPKGEWIVKTQSTFPQYQPNEYECPFCHTIVNYKANFCKICGADMREAKE